MKIYVLAGILLALAPKGCAEDQEEKEQYETTVQADYEELDYKIRNAIDDWKLFKRQSENNVLAARKKISRAADRLDDPDGKNKGQLRNAIFKADSQLEQLSEKLLRGERFEEKIDAFAIDASVIKRMERFMESYREKEAKLMETLAGIEKL